MESSMYILAVHLAQVCHTIKTYLNIADQHHACHLVGDLFAFNEFAFMSNFNSMEIQMT